uniref:Uncharacterized protein n=1 Tax=Rhizophagus irregularis (strain DAOM 181602 / DAOM 197198 / MUCL 43194) TaxID=747089 RepID=U9UFE6_RHIID
MGYGDWKGSEGYSIELAGYHQIGRPPKGVIQTPCFHKLIIHSLKSIEIVTVKYFF